MIEHEILTESQKRMIAEILKKCQECGKKCTPEPHRINRGYNGGIYILRNLYWLCPDCHKQRHQNEKMGRKG